MIRHPVEVEFNYAPREAFIPFHNRAQRFATLVCHRRSGKTVACINDLIIGALEESLARPQFAFLSPTYTQSKRVAWLYLKDAARPFFGGPPNEAELVVTLKNQARIFLAGADNPDSLRGLYLDGAVIDEAATVNPAVWTQIILPALSDRQGWAVLASTPKGKNHFYNAWNNAQINPEWFTLLLRADTSGILPKHELERLLREMPPDEYEQEMLCSFTATTKGSILFREIEEALANGRIVDDDLYDPNLEVFVSSDIGFRDTSAFWFVQKRPDGIAVIAHLEDAGLDADDWIEVLRKQPYPIDEVWLPHDAKARTFTTRHTALETFMRVGWRVRITPRTSVLDRVNAARTVARVCRFQRTKCASGLNALREWSFEWDGETKAFSKTPRHDWASHSGDSFSYMAQMVGNHTAEIRAKEDSKPTVPVDFGTPMNYAFNLEQLFEAAQSGRRNDRW